MGSRGIACEWCADPEVDAKSILNPAWLCEFHLAEWRDDMTGR